MASRQSTSQIKNELDQAIVSATNLLKVLSKFEGEIKGSVAEARKLKDGLNLNKAGDIQKLNDALDKSNALVKQRVDLDRQASEQIKRKSALEKEQSRLRSQEKRELKETNALILSNDRVKRSAIQTAEAENRAKQRARKEAERNKRAILQSTSAYKKLSRITNTAQFRFKELAAQFGVNSKQARNAQKRFDRLDKSIRRINDAARDGRRDVGRYGVATQGLGKNLIGLGTNLVGALGVVGGVQLFSQVLRDSFNIVRTFGAAQSELAGILGQTKEEISELTALSKELGATTVFTATEVSKAQIELAKFGQSGTQIEQSLEGVLDTAVALGTDIPRAATLVVGTLKAFNLEASESNRVAAVLGVASTKSALDISKLETALSGVGPTAATFGLSIEETTAALGLLVDKNIDASTAGRQFRNILLLSNKAGIDYREALDLIANSSDKAATAFDLFGKQGVSVALALSEQRNEINNATDAITNQDAALKSLVDERLNNLDGDLKLLTSTWEGFILGVEDGGGVLNTVARGAIQFLIKAIGEARAILNDIAKPFKELFIEVGKLGDALGIPIENFNAFNILITTTKIGLSPLIFILKKVASALTFIARIGRGTISFFEKGSKVIGEFVDDNKILNVIIKSVGTSVQFIKEKFDDFIRSIKTFVSESNFLSGAIKFVKDEFDRFLDVLKTIKTASNAVIKSVIDLKNELLNIEEGTGSGFGEKYNKFGENLSTTEILAKNLSSSLNKVINDTSLLTGAIERQSKVVSDLEEKKRKASESEIAGINVKLTAAKKELMRLQLLGDKEAEEAKKKKKREEEELRRLAEFKSKNENIEFESNKRIFEGEKRFRRDLEELRVKQLTANSQEEVDQIEEEIQKRRFDRLVEINNEEIALNDNKIQLLNEYGDVVKDSEEKIFKLQKDNIDKINDIKDADFDLNQERRDKELAAEEELSNKIKEKKKKDQEEFDKFLRDSSVAVTSFIINKFKEESEAREEELNQEIQNAKDRQNQLLALTNSSNSQVSQLAAASLAEQRRIEREKTAELEREKKKQAKLEVLLAGLQAYKANAGEINALGNTTTEIGSLISILNNLGSFYKGTDRLGSVDSPLDSNGGRLIRAHDDEMIIEGKDNKDMGFPKRQEVVSVFKAVKEGNLVSKIPANNYVVNNTSSPELLSEVKLMNKNLKNLKTTTQPPRFDDVKKAWVHVERSGGRINKFIEHV